jgi:para-aminobenzoate synthetase component 1
LREPGRDRVFIHPHAEQAFEHNALSAIREWILTHQGSSVAVFYLSYDAALEDLNLLPKASDIQLPKASVHLYDGHLDIDHHAQTITSYALTKSMTQQHQEALITPSPELQPYTYTGDQTANFSFESYAQAFNEVMQGLSQGDFYQINLAQRFRIPIQGSYFSLFEAITKQAPSAFACYWPLDARSSIVCNSPESFIRIDQGRMITEPIKGTMKRHTDPLIDAQWAQALADSEKDQAENLMIVDLMRNDVGKLAIPGSVKVDKLFDIMTLSYAHHMVSQVSAQLPPHVHPLDALLACFPGGSITGAPKRAAMQAIHRLEPHPRHLYCGTIGYLTAEGTLRSNIAIRTAIVQDDMMTFWAGGGLVLDSELRSEYEECMTKTRFALT